jgi:plasmid stability protein
MAKMIQVRNVPDRLHRELMHRARKRGQSLTEFIEQILEREVARPPVEEVLARIASREPIKLDRPIAEIIRAERRRARKS